MPAGPITLGRDISWIINTANGQLTISQNFITSFEAKPEAKIEQYKPVSDIITPLLFPGGYMLDMELARVDNSIDTYWALVEAAYYAGTDVPGGSIYETIVEVDGSTSQYVYQNVQLKVDTFGVRKGQDIVTMKLSGYASRRLPTT